MKKIAKIVAALALAAAVLTGCSDSDTVSHNLSEDADNFKVERQVVLYNGITDEYVLEIVGLCSQGNDSTKNKVIIICKVKDGTGNDAYVKDIYNVSDNMTVFIHQTGARNVSPDHYKMTLKPKTIIPNVDIR